VARFKTDGPLPEGFVYQPEFLSSAEEQMLLEEIGRIQFSAVRMHGVTARRRVAHYGWLYSFESFRVSPGPPIPDFLLPVRQNLSSWAGIAPEDLSEALVTEYPPGATIGWHKDAAPFGIVLAVSLAGTCRLRLRRGEAEQRETAEVLVEPRSAYMLSGLARTQWQHHIPPTREQRYSITFRTLRKAQASKTGQN